MAALSVFSVVLLSLISLSACTFHSARSAKAYVYFARKNLTQLDLCGVLDFQQIGQPCGVRINGTLKGLTPGKHGFHVHERGDIGNGCIDAGGHYNPRGQPHGGPDDLQKHVGDLGNIIANQNGEVKLDVTFKRLPLVPFHSIVGRAIVIHEGTDDLGRGGDEGSRTAGNAGARVACGVIGIARTYESKQSTRPYSAWTCRCMKLCYGIGRRMLALELFGIFNLPLFETWKSGEEDQRAPNKICLVNEDSKAQPIRAHLLNRI